MRSRRTETFRRKFAALPEAVQERARAAYRLFRENPSHPSLRLKKVHASQAVCSVRVGLGYRAIGLKEGEEMIWFWIGSHADYDKLVGKR